MKHKTGTDKSITSKWSRKTQLVRGGSFRSDMGEMSEALFLTSAFAVEEAEEAEGRFDGSREGFVYSRQENPTVKMFENRMALLEGADVGRATATGMAAMHAAIFCQVKSGDHVLASKALFGSNRWFMDELLPRFGVETTVVDGPNLDEWKAGIQDNTTVFFAESMANPTLDMVDIQALADLAHNVGARLVIDNVFSTPVLLNPLDFGADVVAYSTTKHVDGQGRCMGGIVLCSQAFDEEFLYPFFRHTGSAISPFNAWVHLKALETLDMRIHAMCDNAEKVAAALAERLEDVRYPSLPSYAQYDLAKKQMKRGGNMVTLSIPGGKDQAFKFMNALEIFDITNNLGDSRSIATHNWTTTHKALPEETRRELGVNTGMIRMSIGLEDGDDLVKDLMHALDQAGI
ncbi:PLP-dependent transferase [Temperatibacter marinus]|uniref:PLP-dependent transferase n=1 Tax=Temperatibacter marinus TaxID=1456591 RepID=A0AA52EJD5_9PROT|nr:PLP-dependent transferase [Temperatibacter marinus]WND03612.1 PLP-dependent transferase [Temperatibacter marinus]